MTNTDLKIERSLFGVDANGIEVAIHIELGVPYRTDEEDWACDVIVGGIETSGNTIYGFDSWQALTLALGWVHKTLKDHVEKGGVLYWEKGSAPISMSDVFSSGLLKGE